MRSDEKDQPLSVIDMPDEKKPAPTTTTNGSKQPKELRTPRWKVALKVFGPLAVGLIIALLPPPHGLPANAWRYFALFVAVILWVIAEPLPAAVVALAGVVLAAISGLVYASPVEASRWALSGFADHTVWLVFAAYMFALGYTKTGLGKRIALLLIRAMGKRTLGLGYAIAFADLALAPVMPSNVARSGGTIFPIVSQIPPLFGSHPFDKSARKIGAYLMYTALAATCVTSSIFLTASAPNVLAVSLVAKTINVTISWNDWFKGFAPVGVLLLLLVPILVYKVYPPEIKEAPDAPRWAGEELRKMGAVTRKEITLLGLVIVGLIMWIGAHKYVDATMAAILVVVLMVVLRVVSWNDIMGHTQAWTVLIWFATLLTMANGLAETKFVDWVARSIAPTFLGLGTVTAIIMLVGAFYVLQYLFASGTARVSALLPVLLGVAVTIPGVTRLAWALLLCYTIGLAIIVTPYAGAVCPIYFGCGFIKGKDFWLLGLLFGLVFFLVFIVIEVPWLMFLKI